MRPRLSILFQTYFSSHQCMHCHRIFVRCINQCASSDKGRRFPFVVGYIFIIGVCLSAGSKLLPHWVARGGLNDPHASLYFMLIKRIRNANIWRGLFSGENKQRIRAGAMFLCLIFPQRSAQPSGWTIYCFYILSE